MIEGSFGDFVLRWRSLGAGFRGGRGGHIAEHNFEPQRGMAELLERRKNFFAAEIELKLFRRLNE